MLILPKIGFNKPNNFYDHNPINDHIIQSHPQHLENMGDFQRARAIGNLEINRFHNFGGIQSKTVLKDKSNGKQHILKDFNEFGDGGWNEMATKNLFHAGGLHHLIHNVHVITHPTQFDPTIGIPGTDQWTNNNLLREDPREGVYDHPYTSIEVNPDVKAMSTIQGQLQTRQPLDTAKAFHQIATMDYLTNNTDRHSENMMFNEKTSLPFAIDHSISHRFTNNIGEATNGLFAPNNWAARVMRRSIPPDSYHHAAEWWIKNKNSILSNYTQFVNKTLKDPRDRQTYLDNFRNRFEKMDRLYSRMYQNTPYIEEQMRDFNLLK